MLMYEVSAGFPDPGYVGEGFRVSRLVGLYYEYDDVDPHDRAAVDAITAQLKIERARIASGDRADEPADLAGTSEPR